MSKKFIFILIIFLIAIAVLVFVRFIYLNNPTPQFSFSKTSPTPTQASFTLLPNPLTITATRSASLNLALNSNLSPNEQELIQLELSYDPTILFDVSILPGNYFLNPQVLLSNIDVNTGRISYALKGVSTTTNSNIAIITFSVLNYGLQKETEINFLPKTLIRNDNGEIKLGSMSGAKIIIQPSFFYFKPQATASAVIK